MLALHTPAGVPAVPVKLTVIGPVGNASVAVGQARVTPVVPLVPCVDEVPEVPVLVDVPIEEPPSVALPVLDVPFVDVALAVVVPVVEKPLPVLDVPLVAPCVLVPLVLELEPACEWHAAAKQAVAAMVHLESVRIGRWYRAALGKPRTEITLGHVSISSHCDSPRRSTLDARHEQGAS